MVYCKIEVKRVKKRIKWLGLGAGCLIIAFAIIWLCVAVFGQTEGWQGDRYLDAYGVPLTGWQTVDGKTYYFADDGCKVTGWLETEQGKYCLDEHGNPKTGWFSDESGTYLLKSDGGICTGWIETEKGNCYFGQDGKIATGILEQPNGIFSFEADGTPSAGWRDNRYFEKGKALTGWQEIQGQQYYFRSDGVAAEGWQTVEGERYFFANGVACTGWFTEGKDRYYFLENGVMAVGRVEIDGVFSFFTSTGKYVVLVNFEYPVPEDYVMNFQDIEGHPFDADAADDLAALLAAARTAGHPVYINNTYRSVETQKYMYYKRLHSYMDGGMDEYSAMMLITQSLMLPGHSEHHLGLAVDFKCSNAAYKWLAENAWQYGFILRYPRGKSDITGVIYEPWHYRHVGTELAKELYDSGLCMEEYMEEITMSAYEGQ